MWRKIKALQEQIGANKAEMQQILNTAQNEKRDLTADEAKRFDEIDAAMGKLVRDRDRMEAAYGTDTGDPHVRSLIGRDDINPEGLMSAATEWRDATGRPVRVLAANQNLAGQGTNLSLGRAVRAMVTGDWSHADAELRALGTSPTSAGFMVPLAVAAGTIDAARSQSTFIRAGAMFVPMSGAQMDIARCDTDPVAAAKAEDAAFTPSGTFARVTLTAATIGCVSTMSRELAADAANADQVIQEAIARALAVKLDALCVTAVTGTTGVQAVTGVGALADYGKLITAWQKLQEKSASPTAYVLAPRDAGTLEGLREAVGGQYLRPPTAIAALARHITGAIAINGGAGSNESSAFMADFRQLLIGLRQDVLVEISQDAGDSFDKHQIRVKCTWRGDIGLAQPTHFVKLTGITA